MFGACIGFIGFGPMGAEGKPSLSLLDLRSIGHSVYIHIHRLSCYTGFVYTYRCIYIYTIGCLRLHRVSGLGVHNLRGGA